LAARDGSVRVRSRKAIGLLAVLALTSAVAASCARMTPRHDGPVSDHFDGVRFYQVPAVHKGLDEVLKWQLTRESAGPWERDLTRIDTPLPPARADDGILSVTFINHATVLIQVGGLNILTDPIWSGRASPVQAVGPQRFRAPGMRFQDLPLVDLVLVSHNHFDHMDEDTLARLAEDHDPLFVVPLANCRYLERFGVERCRELDWWEVHEAAGGVSIHAVPARHWARRSIADTNRSLWSGFVIRSDQHRIYFAGDTGMGGHFKEIRERLGTPDLAILPIGAYLPRWFMSAQHIDPGEAVMAHRILGAKESMAIHFGTFRLADDGQQQPVLDLAEAMAADGLDRKSFWVPNNGDTHRWDARSER